MRKFRAMNKMAYFSERIDLWYTVTAHELLNAFCFHFLSY